MVFALPVGLLLGARALGPMAWVRVWQYLRSAKCRPEQWKCQPTRWLTKFNEWHAFLLGSTNMLIGSVVSGVISCNIMNGGEKLNCFH
ncbi:hypothetical protein DPMN_101579 [Dreissena polymorpha]|uniref:Uncharacterized protein n=1 Tax=Dreissena polymorpha TaxID=45954 RepID=A0A9D4LJD8_DREPO|nr:hypothetical protein DPMN_101579 [Dreissena polymorpha]